MNNKFGIRISKWESPHAMRCQPTKTGTAVNSQFAIGLTPLAVQIRNSQFAIRNWISCPTAWESAVITTRPV
jgi:hypothetical protein